jgi:uncharacterized protein
MTILDAVVIFFAAMLAGALNSVAGGGSFISFPALLFAGVPPINANTTNTVALWPGTVASVGAYRNLLFGERGRVPAMLAVSLAGGLVGALILLGTPQDTFTRLLPFLLLLATLLFTFSKQITGRVQQSVTHWHIPPWLMTTLTLGLQFIVAIYGGFFGGGIGIMMLAILSLRGMENIHSMNGIKTLLATAINGIAVVAFVLAGTIYWSHGLVMIVGAILGGYGGAYYAQSLDPKKVRWFVIGVGVFMTSYFFIRTYILG